MVIALLHFNNEKGQKGILSKLFICVSQIASVTFLLYLRKVTSDSCNQSRSILLEISCNVLIPETKL